MAEALYDPQELIVFALIGVISGFGRGVIFIHTNFTTNFEKKSQLKNISKNSSCTKFFFCDLII